MNSKNLFSLRVKAKLSVEELSSILDVPVASIRAWENNGKTPTATELRKLSVFYNVPIDYLLGIGEPVERPAANFQAVQPQVVQPQVVQPQVAQPQVVQQSEKKKRGPILNKWWYVAIPSAILVMFILMACPYFAYFNFSLFQATFEAGWATGICTFIFDLIFMLYFFVILFLNRKNLAKFNIANPIILACCFLVNLILSIVVIAQTTGRLGACGVLLHIVWFGMAIYCAAMAILALVRFNQPAPEEMSQNRSQQAKNLTPEQARIAEENARLIKSKQEKEELKKQRKIASFTPAAREERVSKAAKIKLHPWFVLIPVVCGVLYNVLSFSLNIVIPWGEDRTFFVDTSWDTSTFLTSIGLIFAAFFALVDLVVSVIYTKKTKRYEAARCGAILNFFEALLFGAGFCMVLGYIINDEYFGTNILIHLISVGIAFFYTFGRFITCVRKAIILGKAKYLY